MENAKFQWKFGISLHTINIELQKLFYQWYIFCTHPLWRMRKEGGRAVNK
jgi:hypothetical protein